jgi:hypothetical protein
MNIGQIKASPKKSVDLRRTINISKREEFCHGFICGSKVEKCNFCEEEIVV